MIKISILLLALFQSLGAGAQTQIEAPKSDQTGNVHVYLFKGDKLPRRTKVYIKHNSKVSSEFVHNGYSGFELNENTYEFALSKKGPFHEVKVFNGETSQISFDLAKEKKERFVAKYDDFSKKIDVKNQKLKAFKGSVVSKESGQGVGGASVILAGSTLSAKTDENGDYEISVPDDSDYSLSVVHPDFRAEVIEVKSGESASSISMRPSMGELSDYVVTAPKTKGSIEDLLKERRNATAVSVSIGSEQFEKNGDTNAAAALRRVSGLSLVEGKYVYVRGLGERYSSTTLNGSMLPSPNPSRRVVPLDLFPTALIESVLIQKTYSADKPAQFSAGLVEVRTLSIPKKSYAKFSLTSGASSDKILKGDETSSTYEGGGRDRYGKDDGSRALPTAITDVRNSNTEIVAVNEDDCLFFGQCDGLSAEDIADLGLAFSNNYNTDEEKTALNSGISFEGGLSGKLGVLKTGLIAKGVYRNTNDRETQESNGYQLGVGDQLEKERQVTIDDSTSTVNTGGLVSTGVELFKRVKLEGLGLITRSTTNGVKLIAQDVLGNEEDSLRTTRLIWEERELKSLQFKGEINVFENFKGPKVEWFLTKSESSQERPDNRQYSYSLGTNEFEVRNFGNERQFASLFDEARDLNVKISGEVKPLSWLSFKISGGGRSFKKDREYSMQRFSLIRQNLGNDVDITGDLETILDPSNIENGEFKLRDSTTATDNYRADEDNNALFSSITTGFDFTENSKLELITGVRYERHNQSVRAFNIINGENSDNESVLDQNEHFYNYGLVYSATKALKLRLGYSETVARPDLQEFAPVAYINDEENILEIGNPDLEIATVQNFDIRLDYNFNNSEFISFGLFRKDIDKPIETVASEAPGDAQTFKNVTGAVNEGFEFEFRKYLVSGFTLGGNYSVISSAVEIAADEIGNSTSASRPLQGQAPYLVNFALEYEFKKAKLNSALVYNVSGRRIAQTGVAGLPDIYEESFEQLDFVLSKQLTKNLSIGFKAQNLFDPVAARTQGGLPVRGFKYGRRYSINLSTSI
jgi:hypothetical protein